MNLVINSGNGNGGARQADNAPQTNERYFDEGGHLLVCHYPFIYEQITEAAKRHNMDVSWLRPEDTLEERRTAARAAGWYIGAAYGRCSTSMQDSYQGQLTSSIDKGVANNTVIFPELIAGDEGVSGKKSGRVGLDLVKGWVIAGMISVFVAFSVSRLFRRLHTGLKFVREDVIERGVRVLAVAENIDSADRQFSTILNVNMMIAEMQASALPEFVRMGQKAQVENGFLVGACTVGYRAVPVPEAGVTKKSKPKTRPEVVPEVAEMIRRAYERIADGITISEACRQYNQEVVGLPEEIRRYAVDPRSTTGIMRPEAFRKILSRERYLGTWSHGEKRNLWLDGKNATVQVRAPEHEVSTRHDENLRIVSDELFHRVQRKLGEGKRGQHGPRSEKEPSLGTSLTSMYRCAECGHVFHYYGKQYMHCPESTKGSCCNKGTVTRDDACGKIISALRDKVLANEELVAEIVRQSHELDAAMDEGDLTERIGALEKAVRRQNAIMLQIEQSCGDEGMDEDDKTRHKAAKSEKSRLQAELAALKARNSKKREPITESEVKAVLADFDALLADAAAGKLGSDGNQRAAALIRNLVGGVVDVSFTRLQGRRAFGSGTFTPNPALAIGRQGHMDDSLLLNLPSVTVEFRELPRYARIADEVHRLHVEEGLSLTEIGKVFNCGAGNAFGALKYWHESRGLAVPCQKKRHTQAAS